MPLGMFLFIYAWLCGVRMCLFEQSEEDEEDEGREEEEGSDSDENEEQLQHQLGASMARLSSCPVPVVLPPSPGFRECSR